MLKKSIGLSELNKFVKNNCAVSEVMGEVLLTTIAVLLVSSIGIFVSTYDGAVDVPHTQVKEWMNEQTDTIYLEHSGGEFLKTEAFEIAVSINGERYVYSSDEIYANIDNSSSWGLGETIDIDTNSTWGRDIKDEDEIKVFLIDTPTKQVIQQLTVSSGETESSEWVTPQGEVKDTSFNGSATLLDVYKENDTHYTIYHPPSSSNYDIHQEFDFAAPSTLWGIDPGESITSATLKIRYRAKDNSCKDIKLRVWDAYPPNGTWHEETLPVETLFKAREIDLSAYINNTDDVGNFKVQLVAISNPDVTAAKSLNIDYIALCVS